MAAKKKRMTSLSSVLASSAAEDAKAPEGKEPVVPAAVPEQEPTPEPAVGEGGGVEPAPAQPQPEPAVQAQPVAQESTPQPEPVQSQAPAAPVQDMQPIQPQQPTIVRPAMVDTSRTDTMGLVRTLAATLNRKEVRMRSDQFATLTDLVRAINRERTMKVERITENTILRIALDAFIRDYGQTVSGNTENELRQSIGLDPMDLV